MYDITALIHLFITFVSVHVGQGKKIHSTLPLQTLQTNQQGKSRQKFLVLKWMTVQLLTE